MKFQLQAAVEIDPKASLLRFTARSLAPKRRIVFAEGQARPRQMALFPEDRALPGCCEASEVVQVRLGDLHSEGFCVSTS